MLEGAPKIGAACGTPDSNWDMGAFRDQEEGGMQALPSKNDAQLKHFRAATAVKACGSPCTPRL